MNQGSSRVAVQRRPMRIFVAGTWSLSKAMPFADLAWVVGKRLAEEGFDLTTGPGTGLSRFVIAGYVSVAQRGKTRAYLPRREEMEKVGETVDAEFDELIETDFDYPMRNVLHAKDSDAVVVITGGDGTLEETLPALIDYHRPVIVVNDSGNAARALRILSESLFVEWKELLRFTNSADGVMESLLRALDVAHPTSPG